MIKTCVVCGGEFQATGRNALRRLTCSAKCNDARRKAQRLTWFYENAEAERAKARKWKRDNKDHCREITKRWRARNPDKVKECDARRYLKHGEKRRAYDLLRNQTEHRKAQRRERNTRISAKIRALEQIESKLAQLINQGELS